MSSTPADLAFSHLVHASLNSYVAAAPLLSRDFTRMQASSARQAKIGIAFAPGGETGARARIALTSLARAACPSILAFAGTPAVLFAHLVERQHQCE